MNNRIILLAMLGALVACAGDSAEQESQVQIDSSPEVCTGVGQQLCLRVRSDAQQQWNLHYGGIQGFDFSWGYVYTLAITEAELENPPADGSSIEWVLLDVVAQQEDEVGAAYTFDNVVMQGSTITYSNEDYEFIGYPFTCAAGLDCDSLLALNTSNQSVSFEFRYLGDAQVELVSWQ